jgi:hypothetical protein
MSDNMHQGSDFNEFLNDEITKESAPNKDRNKQKWLTDKLRGKWLDKDLIIEITLIECLRHYVEEEKGLEHRKYLAERAATKKMTNEVIARLQDVYDDLSSAYEYIIAKYDKQDEEMADLTVGQIFAASDRQQQETDDAIAKIWKHYQKMWT